MLVQSHREGVILQDGGRGGTSSAKPLGRERKTVNLQEVRVKLLLLDSLSRSGCWMFDHTHAHTRGSMPRLETSQFVLKAHTLCCCNGHCCFDSTDTHAHCMSLLLGGLEETSKEGKEPKGWCGAS